MLTNQLSLGENFAHTLTNKIQICGATYLLGIGEYHAKACRRAAGGTKPKRLVPLPRRRSTRLHRSIVLPNKPADPAFWEIYTIRSCASHWTLVRHPQTTRHLGFLLDSYTRHGDDATSTILHSPRSSQVLALSDILHSPIHPHIVWLRIGVSVVGSWGRVIRPKKVESFHRKTYTPRVCLESNRCEPILIIKIKPDAACLIVWPSPLPQTEDSLDYRRCRVQQNCAT